MNWMTNFAWLVTIIALLFLIIFIYFKWKFSYWAQRMVPHIKPSFLVGNFGGLGSRWSFTELLINLYEEKKNEKICGIWIFHKPALLINDPHLIKRVLVKDFATFHDHSAYSNEKDDPLSAHLFSLRGDQWRNLRTKLTPSFTSGKLKNVFSTVLQVGELLQTVLDPIAKKQGTIEAKDTIARYSIDVIGSVAFGIETRCLEDPDSIFKTMARKVTAPEWDTMARAIIAFLIPDLAKILKLRVFDRKVSKFFLDAMKDTVEYRKEHNLQRNDLMQLLMQLMEKGYIDDDDERDSKLKNKGDTFTFNQLAAQAFIFFIAGFESTSSTVQFALYELARNPNIQGKLRKEVLSNLARNNGRLTYEGLNELKYTQMVLEESLRKYPPAGVINRECNQDYKIPGTSVVLEKGTAVYVSIPGLHRDSRYFPEPETFDPERFSDERKAKMSSHVYLPFGDGPRICIGVRFAMMQMKIALVSLISKFRFEPCESTPETLKFDPKSIILLPQGGLQLKISSLQ